MKQELARHDSLRQARRITDAALRDSLQLADSLQALSDTLLAELFEDLDSLAVADSLEFEKLLQESSLALDSPGDSTAVAKDSLSAASPVALTAQELREKKKAERAARREARIAAKEARWAELDARDAAKAAAEQEKEKAKKRAANLKLLLANQKEEYQDSLKREKYIQKYQKAKARADAKAARKKSKKNSPDLSPDTSASPSGEEIKKAD